MESENPGKFADDIVDSSKEGTKYDWRDLARQLQSPRGDLNNKIKGKLQRQLKGQQLLLVYIKSRCRYLYHRFICELIFRLLQG